MKKVIVVIATKNRLDLLKRAVRSVLTQTRQADEIIITSDSESEIQLLEQELCRKNGLSFIRNQYAKNYAGNLNTAIDYIVFTRKIKINEDIRDIFVAFLDDDDTWHSDYLTACIGVIKQNTDFIVTGLVYHEEDQDKELSIPDNLTIHDFLEKNPHIQGSNTFIRLTTLLKAGCFDENMSSTTDRDLFVRVMMLNPKYEIIHRHLVNIDANRNRTRLTINQNSKRDSFAKFYAKYGGLMGEKSRKVFFCRANRFTPLSEENIAEILGYPEINQIPIKENIKIKQRVVFAFVSVNSFFTKRLVSEIKKQNLKNNKIVCITNYINDVDEVRKFFDETGVSYALITLEDIASLLHKKEILPYLDREFLKNGYIKDIAIARSILHYYSKQESKDGDIIWILDDDMEFSQNVVVNGKIIKQPLDIDSIIYKYHHKYDVVVGSYSQDAPLPTLSSLRTALLDYVYHYALAKNQYYDKSIYHLRDYYYDLADGCHRHLETPTKLTRDCTLEEILSGKAVSRVLFSTELSEFKPYSRGGNTLVFNRKVLDIPNISLTLENIVARRGDYFWVQQVRKQGYSIIGSTFSTFHNRKVILFDYQQEIDKQMKDLIGSSFTKAYENLTDFSKFFFYQNFKEIYQKRLVRIIVNYFRIIGLFKIINNKFYLSYFNELNLDDFIRTSKKYLDQALIQSSFRSLCSQMRIHQHSLDIPKYQSIIEKTFSTKITILLGQGEEGVVFSDGNYVYKIFYNKINSDILHKYSYFEKCSELFEVNIAQINSYTIFYYRYSPNYQQYNKGFSIQIANLIRFLRAQGMVLTNIKKQNFIITNGQLKFIDYGKNIESYTPEKYQKSVERAYQMLKYPNLTSAEYNHMISRSYLSKDDSALFGLEHFQKLLSNRYKEQIHDPIVIDIIKQLNPINMLDYGAGKCKIANKLSEIMSVSVFDINTERLKARANKGIILISDIEKVNQKFDLINSNLVLCCIDNKQVEYVLNKINSLLSDNGHLVLSICHPFFDDIEKTEIKSDGYHQDYSSCNTYLKKTKFICRDEYHRPFSFYQRVLQREGFEIIEIREDNGVNAESLNPISEHLIMVCRKINKPILDDCTLLIKTNPMEHQTIYKNIVHIVHQLEKQCLFSERIVVVDYDSTNRVRRHAPENREILLSELRKLLANSYIDRVIVADRAQQDIIYKKYFATTSDSTYALNGQALLSSLVGFEAVTTRYVFQTDSDILYHNSSIKGVQTALDVLKTQQVVTLSLSICHSDANPFSFGHRVEVRSSFLDLHRLRNLLPLTNPIEKGIFSLPWHRALDNQLDIKDSIRLHQSDLFFVHPENNLKNTNLIAMARDFVEQGENSFNHQKNKVNLVDGMNFWLKKSCHPMVLFIRGRNTPPEKLKRLFDSLKEQTYQYFHLVYIDDASNECSSAYAELLFKYDTYFKNKVISIFNDFRVGSLANFEIMYQYIVKNPNAIIVNIDNDDCLLRNDALSTIQSQFDLGADVTVGNCFRADKPLRNYLVDSFKDSWKRNGDNIWLHPKCFRKYLCNYIQDNLLINGNYIDVATDYAIMLPIVQHAEKPVFIQNPIYYFDASKENRNRVLQYKNAKKMKQFLLLRAEQDNRRKIVAIIGDSNIVEQSPAYHLAYELGKALVDNGFRVQTGGLGGVMEAAMKGAKSSHFYQRGDTIAIIPSLDETEVNDYADVVIPTGLNMLRNGKVVQADVVIAIGGGAGTLSEMAMAWQQFKLIIAFRHIKGWSKRLADKKIDERKRYSDISDDRVYGVDNIDEALALIKKLSDKYNRVHHGIKLKKTIKRN